MLELYKSVPVICTIWAFIEVILFGGLFLGWGPLVLILKNEELYLDECTNSTKQIGTENVSLTLSYVNNTELIDKIGCVAQDSKLNLWFSIGCAFSYMSMILIGWLIRLAGIRIVRIIFIIVYVAGSLCLAFASKDAPWLVLPGLCCMGSGGLTLLCINTQVAMLYPKLRSSIIAVFAGAFEFSSFGTQLIVLAYENGVARRTSYCIVAGIFAVMTITSTLVFLPRTHWDEEHILEISLRVKRDNKSVVTEDPTTVKEPKEAHANQKEPVSDDSSPWKTGNKIASSLLSLHFVFHWCWTVINALRFFTFIGHLDVWMRQLYHDDVKVANMLSVFSYITLASIVSAFMTGYIYDSMRKRFAGRSRRQQSFLSILLPMCLCILFSTLTTCIWFIESRVATYMAFLTFTFFRGSFFTVAFAFLGDAFPMRHFSVLYGFMEFAIGVSGMIQVPVFQWSTSYVGSDTHANILLLGLQLATIVHPILLCIRGSRGSTDPVETA